MTHLMTDEEFASLLSLPLEELTTFPYGYDRLPSLSATHLDEPVKSGTPDASGTGLLSPFLKHASYDTSMPLLTGMEVPMDYADLQQDCTDFQQDFVDFQQGMCRLPQMNATVFNLGRLTGVPDTNQAGSEAHSEPLLNIVQAALDQMIAKQEEHAKCVVERQNEQDRQLGILSDKLNTIRDGLDKFSADVWRWTRPTGLDCREEMFSSEADYSDMSGVTAGETCLEVASDWLDNLP
ncbi:hypothetical protein CDEST_14407 [Colletotrichum destructivum]|uniref:Uncharacterized protein n=1 Tax=Colletotrichum destructivum TaxID=34406 RepID=A0AAX4J1V9_9PEZI|nr:hypothetical protein CDEST_14407 [Colletotrichum destructivum]